MQLAEYKDKARDIRKMLLRMHTRACTSHIGSSLSCVELLVSLYFDRLNIDPKNPVAQNRDRFILSKGHAVSCLYATLAEREFFPKELLENYCCDGSTLPGHATLGSVPGIEVSTGSLGQGLPIGNGIALAGKCDGHPYKVFVLMSDGECDEGSVWEAALFASHHELDNLVAIVDYNKIQALGYTKDVLKLDPFADKWKAFGWEIKEIDGHNFEEIETALKKIPFVENKPSLIIAHTVKGKGVSFMEDKLLWHYRSPNNEECEKAMKELNG